MSNFQKILIIFTILLSGCTQKPSENIWSVELVVLPQEITIKNSVDNAVSYIIKQSHEPLVFKKNNQEYGSKVLDSWSANLESTQFRFCPKSGILFSEGHPFDAKFLHSFLNHLVKEGTCELTSDNTCVLVNFKQPNSDFLLKLSSYQNAPTIRLEGERFERGLGSYEIKNLTENQIEMHRKVPKKFGFNSIIFHRFNGASDPHLQDHSIQDFNRLSVDLVPAWVKAEFSTYQVNPLQTGVLVISDKDVARRRAIYGCIDIDGFRRAFSPGVVKFRDVNSIIPNGMPGAEDGKAKQMCDYNHAHPYKGKPFLFLNWKSTSLKSFTEYFEQVAANTGIKVEVKSISSDVLLKIALNQLDENFFAIIGFDSSKGDYREFYDFFYSSKNHFKHVYESSLFSIYQEFLKTYPQEINKDRLYKLNAGIRNGFYAVPIFQQIRDYYFPKEIRGLELGKNELDYPDVDSLLIE